MFSIRSRDEREGEREGNGKQERERGKDGWMDGWIEGGLQCIAFGLKSSVLLTSNRSGCLYANSYEWSINFFE